MALKKFHSFLTSFFFIIMMIFSTSATFAHTLQISTRLKSIEGAPIWLLVIRNIETGKVDPYIFDIREENNVWLASTSSRTYWITASSLTFGPYAKINNFCNLQNKVLTGKSLQISITGVLSPDPHSFKCHVLKFND